jgi:hypothetical protein
MIETVQIPNEVKSDSVFWIFRIWDLFGRQFVSVRGASFVLRILIAGCLDSWRDERKELVTSIQNPKSKI